MSPLRRRLLARGGGLCATLILPRTSQSAAAEVIEMRGSARGERIWFAPRGLAVASGTLLRFLNRDQGNSHTTTAYHPDNLHRTRRIPVAAEAWDSGYLLPGENFEVRLVAPGAYDYYCIPHEMAGMIGRIVVGRPGDPGWEGPAPASDDISPEAYAAFPSVEEILARGRIEDK